jgi:hypothetical protein
VEQWDGQWEKEEEEEEETGSAKRWSIFSF